MCYDTGSTLTYLCCVYSRLVPPPSPTSTHRTRHFSLALPNQRRLSLAHGPRSAMPYAATASDSPSGKVGFDKYWRK